MAKHDLAWFQDRKGKEIIRQFTSSEGVTTETKVTIQGEKGDGFVEYFFGLQDEGYTFRDTGATIAAEVYDFDLPEVEQKKAGKIKLHIGDVGCESCSA